MNDINQTQEKATSEQSDSQLVSNVRRRLIKGTAITLPVVITLRSGAAMAAATNEECIAQDQKLAFDNRPGKFKNNNNDAFLRAIATLTRVIKIKDVSNTGTPKWVYDKKGTANNDGTFFKYRTVYAHGHLITAPPSPLPTVWLTSGNDPQKQYIDQTTPIDVYDSAADTTPDITGRAHFVKGSQNFVQDETFGTDGLDERFGLVATDENGELQEDEFGIGLRFGRFVNHEDVQATNNHLTGSCWSSLNPNEP